MIKKRYLTLALVLSLIGINESYAACEQEEINEFKKVEKEYKVTYELNYSTKLYNVIFHRDINKKYTYAIDNNINSNNIMSTDTSIIFDSIPSGEYTIGIINYNSQCQEQLKTFTIKVPRYNYYSEDPLCEGIEEFYLCQESYEKEIDRETFESRVNTYIKKKTQKEQDQLSKEPQEEKNDILIYIKENITQIIIVAVFILLLLITTIVMIKQSRKSRRLE